MVAVLEAAVSKVAMAAHLAEHTVAVAEAVTARRGHYDVPAAVVMAAASAVLVAPWPSPDQAWVMAVASSVSPVHQLAMAR
nr:unnamed protein product [Digitaria exilis]